MQANPGKLYAAIGGALGAVAGVYYLLFGGSGNGEPSSLASGQGGASCLSSALSALA